MSQRRLQRVAIGCAVIALIIAVIAAWVAVRRGADGDRDGRASVRVRADELARLAAQTTRQAGDGVRVTDDALAGALGLGADDVIVAISGRAVAHPAELAGVVRELAAFRPRAWFVQLVRGGERRIVRWELDGDPASARSAAAASEDAGGRDPLIATVRRLDATTYELPRSTVEAWTADPSRLIAGVASAQRRASPAGFELGAIRPGSIAAALGLESGDRLRAVNGESLASLEAIASIVARSTARISLDLERRGRTVILNYLIR